MADNKDEKKQPASWKHLTSGIMGGMGLVLAGHPLDTIKVRMQTMPTPAPGQAPMFTGMIDCLVKTVRNETVFGLFKGMGSPLVGVPPMYAVVFASYGWCAKLVRDPATGDAPLSIWRTMLAGAGSGAITTVVTTPVEGIKARLQVQYHRPKGTPAEFSGPFDAARKIFVKDGVKGLMRGFWPTFARDVPGSMSYFGAYEFVRRMFVPEGGTLNDVHPLALLFAGGMGGMANWMTIFPVDVVKSRVQTSSSDQYKGMVDCFQKIVAKEGYGALFRGLAPCLVRAFPANAACFAAYELTMRVLNKVSP
eukprot:TRINITY_DN5493_c0_g1_i2.p2 TRINITY_DN5493_c0_g1~~TRINITY_DN5493_c0_g1_i2.p2  ORF type:complete len:318 (+),score=68.18 TRINITY_DN5493_c0_g1_i2:35-955(+)